MPPLASWMLRRIEATKDREERRCLDGFLDRLSVLPSSIVKGECPDFFVRFAGRSRSIAIGCEIVRFDSLTEGPTRIEHGQRWRAFAMRLRESLLRRGLLTYGAVHLRTELPDAFDTLLRHPDRAVLELCRALERTRMTTGRLHDFEPASETMLRAAVDHIFLRPAGLNDPELWWCASLQAGELAEPWGPLCEIVGRKNEKAKAWDWRGVDERWLVVVAEAQTLGDTMVLDPGDEGRAVQTVVADAFTRVFAWDGFQERIHQLHPSFGLTFHVTDRGSHLHRPMFPAPLIDLVTRGSRLL